MFRTLHCPRLRVWSLVASGLLLVPPQASAGCFEAADDQPRTLILALDGVPLRAVEQARELGAFSGWPQAVPLISTFPSVTNVAFTAMFEGSGIARSIGYEVQWYDVERNEIMGGSFFGYGDHINAWRDVFDVTGRSIQSKVAVYTGPNAKAEKELDAAEQVVLDPSTHTVLGHVGGTDALIHLRGDERIVSFLVELDGQLQELQRIHRERLGSELRILLVSDHGNTSLKVRKFGSLKKRLRRAGLRDLHYLERSDDVVAATFGILNYGALYTAPENAETAARATAAHPHVDFASWRGSDAVHVVSRDGWARILRKDDPLRLRYEQASGDPLRLASAVAELAERGRLDADGFALDEDWLAVTASGEFPDALRRLVDAMDGSYVRNSATVLFSIEPGYGWGWRSAHASSKLSGGYLEGTHGGMDHDSSTGFFLSDDPALMPPGPTRIQDALKGFHVTNGCIPTELAAD